MDKLTGAKASIPLSLSSTNKRPLLIFRATVLHVLLLHWKHIDLCLYLGGLVYPLLTGLLDSGLPPSLLGKPW